MHAVKKIHMYTTYTLVGPLSQMTRTSPPRCLHLDNRLYIPAQVWHALDTKPQRLALSMILESGPRLTQVWYI